MEVGPVFEDSIGAQLLTDVLTMTSNIKERHDTLEFVNHIYINHKVRLVVGVDRLPGITHSHVRESAPYKAWGRGALQTARGRVLVPLGDLDRHSQATTHVTNEAGAIAPLFTTSELNRRLGSGLVCYAARALGELSPDLVQHLYRIPAKAGERSATVGSRPQEAADQAFETACEELLAGFGRDAVRLLGELSFRLALVAVTSAVQLVVEVDPAEGPTRVLSYSYVRPIRPRGGGGGSRPWIRRRLRPLGRFVARSGTTILTVDLGPMGGCERYHLTAEAPFDTWFANAQMERGDPAKHEPGRVDTSQEFRLSYTQVHSDTPWSGSLRVELRTVYTGIVRAGVFAGAFLAVCAVAGLVRVCVADGHELIPRDTDAAASLLLLFPGIAASAVAGVAKNTLTATLQLPVRFTLWCMSLTSFALATAAAFRLGGVWDIALWGLVSALMCAAAWVLYRRSRFWRQSPDSVDAHSWGESDSDAAGGVP